MRLLCKLPIAFCGLTLLTSTPGQVQGAALPVSGWRGNWTGRFPDSSPPREWNKVSKILWGLRCSAAKPRGDTPQGSRAFCGAITEWLILGPLPAAVEGKSIDSPLFPDESACQPDAGEKIGDFVWGSRKTNENMLDFSEIFGKEGRGVAYAHSYLWSETEGTVRLRFLHYKDLKAYLNGQPIWPGKEPVNVKLSKGWNRLLCKVNWAPQEGTYNIYPSLWHFGVSITAVAPCETETQNILWQTRLPNWSIAGPVIVGDRIFVMSEPNDLLCLNKADGRILWVRSNNFYDALAPEERKSNPAFADIAPHAARLKEINDSLSTGQAPDSATLEEKGKLEGTLNDLMRKVDLDKYNRNWGELHGNCVGTPCSDGRNVYVWLSFGIAACYDMSGNRKWIALENFPIKHHGFSSSPLLVDGKLIVYMKKLIAFEAETGRVAWRTEVLKDDNLYGDHFHDSPIQIQVGGESLLYVHGQIFRPADGKTLWEEEQWKEKATIPTPIVANGFLYHVTAAGNVRKAKLPASVEQVSLVNEGRLNFFGGVDAYTRHFFAASPLYHEGLLYLIDCMGKLRVVDADKQELVYEKDLGLGLEIRSRVHIMGTAYASPVLTGKYLLAVGMTGTMVAFASGRKYRELARNKIEHVTNPGMWYEKPEGFASPPVCDGNRLYLRGDEYLYCIGKGPH